MTASLFLTQRQVERRLSLIYGAVFLVFGVQSPFIGVWLGEHGLNLSQIGLVLALPRVLQFIGVPILARAADKRGAIAQMIAASAILMTALFGLLIFVSGTAPVILTVCLLFMAQAGAMPLCDVLTFSIFRPGEANASGEAFGENFDYGKVRKWGSAAFIAGNFGGGLFLYATSIGAMTLALTVTAALAVGAARFALPLDALTHRAKAMASTNLPRRASSLLIAAIAANVLIQSSHVFVQSFGAIHWTAVGRSNVAIGALWAIGVTGETLFFWLFGRWRIGVRHAPHLVILGGATAVVRWIVMIFDPPIAILGLAQFCHGITYAATHVGTMMLLSELAPAKTRARVQGWNTAIVAGASAALMPTYAPLYKLYGEYIYGPMAMIAGIGLVVAISVALRRQT